MSPLAKLARAFTLICIAAQAFGACPTSAPTVVSPTNGQTGVSTTTTLHWTNVGSGKFDIYYATGNTCPNQSTPSATETATSFSFPQPLQAGTKYSWYVIPIDTVTNTRCTAQAMACANFVTQASSCPANPGTPANVSPASGATAVTSPVTFQWSGVTGANSYTLFASVNGGTPFQVGSTTTTSLTSAIPQGAISWAVQASFGPTCATTVSHATTFTVASPTVCNAPAPAPLAPMNGATVPSLPVTFQWSASSGAIGYQLFLQNGSDDFQEIAETSSTSVQRLVPTGINNWYVVAKYAGCSDQKSATFTFNVPPNTCIPEGTPIILNGPANGATVTSPVTFSWQAVTGVVTYRIWIDLGDQNPVIIATSTSNSATVHLPSGSIEWWVEGVYSNQSCGNAISGHSKITVQGASNCGANTAPTLVTPTGNVSPDVTFQWSPTSNAVAYRVWLAPSGQPFDDITLTNKAQFTQTLTPGVYSWYVQAYYDGCQPVTSATAQFTVTQPPCPTTPPGTLTPVDGATQVTSPVSFAWTAVAGATKYRVFARSNDLGTHILLGETEGTSLTKALPSGRIGWHVDAIVDSCPTLHSPEVHFTIPQSQNCSNTPAQLLLPADGATVPTQPITFDWNEVSGAAGYVLVARINDGAATALTETTDTQFTKHLTEGKVEWWVITFVSGCSTVESQHFTFTIPATTCPTKAPLLLSPRSSGVVTSPVTFAWTPVTGATRYRVWVVASDGTDSIVDSTDQTSSKLNLPTGSIQWFVEAVVGTSCPTLRSAQSPLKIIDVPPCATPVRPSMEAPGAAVSGSRYTVRWTNVPNAASYDLQEATKANFSDATTVSIIGNSATFTHTTTAIVKYLYRVRAVSSCSDDHGRYSDVVSVTILPPKPSSSQQHISAEFGGTNPVTQTIFLPGKSAPVSFTTSANKPWISITPSSGTLPTTGTTLTVTADPKQLNLGTNTGTITIIYTGASSVPGGATTMATTTFTPIPLSVSLVTPVAIGGKDAPPPDSLIIPAVGHAAGVGDSLFESDVRVANTSAQVMKYQVNFTPTGTDGTTTGNSTTIQIDPGATLALDDILASFFGSTSSTALGTLELRPLTSTTSNAAFTNLGQTLTTVASSRTYNFTANGTFGQFIPAIPFSQFIGNTSGILSLQQIAQSAAYRTNFGLVEGAGEPADVVLTVRDNAGNILGTINQSLLPNEHLQLNSLLAANNISLTDGRVEVAVTSPTGKVSAYASTIDNLTNDPLMVSPVLEPSEAATRFVLPGVGDFDSGFAHWKSDVRLFDSGSADTPVTMSYYAQGKADQPITVTSSVKAGQVLALDNFIASKMPQAGTNTAGSLVVTTPSSASLVVTGRTYTDTGNGTYGQFIPAVTPADSVGLNERTLQILQLEQSSRMRSNIGVVETSGNPVTVQLSIILPDSRVTPVVTLNLAANEFVQISLGSFGYTDSIYNARAVVKVTGGTGRVTAYGSVIDQITQDPAYVPAQ